jgi:dipeptidyl aminopeptidase/acylaminoacyl peptidase|tara:strand:+ start:115136 stop:117097 length:1962 start_codon:yes stop_codon:yes gene_type:complete
MKQISPFGSWESPIGAEMMVSSSLSLSDARSHNGLIFWHESRPSEQGRGVIVCRDIEGTERDLISPAYSARSGVHEYGGRCYALSDENLYFVNSADQQIYRHLFAPATNSKPIRITPADGRRYADLEWVEASNALVAVCEDHRIKDAEPLTSIVILDLNQSDQTNAEVEPLSLVSGADFYAYPRVSADQNKICWIEWNHPEMPWFSNRLWTADLHNLTVSNSKKINAGAEQAIFQPEWHSNGNLYFCSDENNYWNIYCSEPSGELERCSSFDGECGLPLWQFGMQTYAFLGVDRALCGVCTEGVWRLLQLNLTSGKTEHINSGLSLVHHISSDQNTALVISSSPVSSSHIQSFDQELISANIKTSSETSIPIEAISIGSQVEFTTTDSMSAKGFFYPPKNPKFQGVTGSTPPLVVLCHGGPTAATASALNLKVQFWTSRGFAVFDVNYRGSTGYGRDYRALLNGKWGIYDVEDACAAAEYACNQGWSDPAKTIIRGSSAGGYTVLSALTFHDSFAAGGCLYGIGDLKSLVGDTHKFEARYGDCLIGPWPEGASEYDLRSPINYIDQLACPVIFFQGLKDKVVPPNQAEMMAEALAKKGLPVAHVTYAGEGHGFRSAQNIVHSFNAELAFYGKVFGFDTDSSAEDLDIRNLPRL